MIYRYQHWNCAMMHDIVLVHGQYKSGSRFGGTAHPCHVNGFHISSIYFYFPCRKIVWLAGAMRDTVSPPQLLEKTPSMYNIWHTVLKMSPTYSFMVHLHIAIDIMVCAPLYDNWPVYVVHTFSLWMETLEFIMCISLQEIVQRNDSKCIIKQKWMDGTFSNIDSYQKLPRKAMCPLSAESWGEILEAELARETRRRT